MIKTITPAVILQRNKKVKEAVDRRNLTTTLDNGNFLCIDVDAIVGVKKLPIASLIHFKDFYIRPYYQVPGTGTGKWFKSANDNYLGVSIVEQLISTLEKL